MSVTYIFSRYEAPEGSTTPEVETEIMTCSDDLDCVNDVRNGQCINKTGRCQCNISDGYECARSDNTVMAEIAGQVVQRCRGGGRCTPSVLSNQKNDYHDVVLDINPKSKYFGC